MRKNGVRAAIAALALTVAALAAGALTAPVAQAKGKPIVGQAAPDFELTLVDGGKVTLSQLRGQVVVLNFWATWCGPCRTELPTLDAYYSEQRKHGMRVFAITTEGSVPIAKLRGLFKALRIDSARKITGGYGPMKGVPTNFVIDRAGKLRYAQAGALDLDSLNTVLVPLLREKAPG